MVSVLNSELLDAVKAQHKGGDSFFTFVPRIDSSDALPVSSYHPSRIHYEFHKIMNGLLKDKSRTISEPQKEIALNAFKQCPLPLYVRVASGI